MATGKFISYLRVSTARQGQSGLGLEAQRKAVLDWLNGGRHELVAEFVEVESGKNNDRPKLADALAACRIHNATLVIAKLDRLSRNAGFLINLQNAGTRFVAVDMPEANELVVGIMACVAQAERKMISTRTKAALAAAKARGVRLGNPSNLADGKNSDFGRAKSIATRIKRAEDRALDLGPVLGELRREGAVSLRQLAAGLNKRGIPTARGGKWSAVQVKRVLERR
jgi:DNA invertase Pin-like site-specific DNA recombinase